MLISEKDVAGAVAMWAIRQSPYKCPDNLATVIEAVQARFEPNAEFGYRDGEEQEHRKYVRDLLRGIPEYLAWNERKNGNTDPFHFTSRYDMPGNPDDDFIDLDALERNVMNTLREEDKW
jgi:hypothetical protein